MLSGRLSRAAMNILVCTPGRLLQHMDESPAFDATNLQASSYTHRSALPVFVYSTTVCGAVSALSWHSMYRMTLFRHEEAAAHCKLPLFVHSSWPSGPPCAHEHALAVGQPCWDVLSMPFDTVNPSPALPDAIDRVPPMSA